VLITDFRASPRLYLSLGYTRAGSIPAYARIIIGGTYSAPVVGHGEPKDESVRRFKAIGH
jgi:hypothetical protein